MKPNFWTSAKVGEKIQKNKMYSQNEEKKGKKFIDMFYVYGVP